MTFTFTNYLDFVMLKGTQKSFIVTDTSNQDGEVHFMSEKWSVD